MIGPPATARASDDHPVAVILAGGGAAGAYEVGVIKALTEGRSGSTGGVPLEAGIFTGTSVGAYNAAFMAMRPRAAARQTAAELDTIWRRRIAASDESCGNGVYRLRFGVLSQLDPACYAGHPLRPILQIMRDGLFLARSGMSEIGGFLAQPGTIEQRMIDTLDLSVLFDVAPFHHLVRETIDPQALDASDVMLRIAATDWNQGTLRIFNRREVAALDCISPIVGSASLPGVFPPVMIENNCYVDGGVVLNTPMAPAIVAGAQELHILDVAPKFRPATRFMRHSSGEALYRMTTMSWSASLDFYLNLGRGWNRLVESGASAESLRIMASTMLVIPEAELPYEHRLDMRPLTAHLYRPADYVGGFAEWLDFSSENVNRLIDQGYRDTVEHDCASAGCLVSS